MTPIANATARSLGTQYFTEFWDIWDGEATGVTPPGETGTRNDGDIVRTVEVIVRESDSFAALKVLPSNAAGEPLGEEKDGAVGGKLWGQVEVTVGINQKLDATLTGVVARVEETDEMHAGQTSPPPYFETPISFTQGWQHLRDRDENGALLPEAQWQWVEGGIATEVKDYEVKYRKRFSWDSTKQPLGHNGEHLVSLMKNGENVQLRFVKINGDTYESGPSSRNVDVQNLVIEDVSTSNGTIDYFKFKADSENESLREPKISFTVTDKGDSHIYRWRVRVRSTNTEELNDSVVYEALASAAEEVTVTVNKSPVAAEFNAATLIKEAGSYNFEISVREYASETEANAAIAASRAAGILKEGTLLDTINLRSTLLIIPHNMPVPHQDKPGHDGWIDFTDELHPVWHLSHYFKDEERGNDTAVKEVRVDLLPPDLSDPLAQVPMPSDHNTPYLDRVFYTFKEGEWRNNAEWIAVTTAQDDHADIYRDHKNRSILAKNHRVKRAFNLP